jgi:hypothetical protein
VALRQAQGAELVEAHSFTNRLGLLSLRYKSIRKALLDMKHLRLLHYIGLVILLMSSRPAGAQLDAVHTWSPPFEVSNTVRFSWFPDLVVSPLGIVHVVWASGNKAAGNEGEEVVDLLRYRELRNGVWSDTNDVLYTGVGGYTVRNSMVFGRDGMLYILVRMQTQIFTSASPADRAWSAKSWRKPQPVTPPGSYYTALAVDNDNSLHAFWSEAVIDDPKNLNPNCPACSDLFYRRSDDGGATWTATQNLANTLDDGENRPQVAIDNQDRVHAVWDQGVDWFANAGVPKYSVYRRSDDGGATWSPAVLFGSPEAPVQQIAIAVDANGNPFVVYRSAIKPTLYYQRSGDGGNTWSTPAEIPGLVGRSLNDNNLDRYSLAFDSAGHVHILLSGFLDPAPVERENPYLLHSSFDGLAWSVPQVVMGNELYPEWPKIVSFAGNQLHATWFTRHKEDLFGSDKGAHYQVWYSNLQLATPPIAPLPLFTPVPTAPPEPTAAPPTPLPSPTPLPAAVAQAPIVSAKPQWEAPAMVTITLALGPVVGLLALCAAFVWWRRRG